MGTCIITKICYTKVRLQRKLSKIYSLLDSERVGEKETEIDKERNKEI